MSFQFSMDIDPPATSGSGQSTLKRSCSAPTINVINPVMPRDEPVAIQPLSIQPRIRRFSASFSPVSGPHSPGSSHHVRTPSRISQIKQEEGMDVTDREVAHEREIQSALQMSQSWEDLTLTDSVCTDGQNRKKSVLDSLHILPPTSPMCSSPSPTRLGKQCFSPSMQQPVKSTSLATSPIPSPTRRPSCSRSLSPIALRPSQLLKRKCETEGETERCESFLSPSKRFHSGSITPDRFLHVLPHPLTHSLSSSSLEDSASPDQAVPISGVGTPESFASSDSPGSMFKPIEQDNSMQSESAPPTPLSLVIGQDGCD